MRYDGLDELQDGLKISRKKINDLRYADDTNLMAENEKGTKELLDEGKRGEWKIWLNHFTANRCGKSGNGQILFSWSPKSLSTVTADMKLKDSCSLEEKLWQT